MKRRNLLTLLSSYVLLGQTSEGPNYRVSTNTYPWRTFAKRGGRAFERHSKELLVAISSTGIGRYEPIIEKVGEFKGLGVRLKKHGLEMSGNVFDLCEQAPFTIHPKLKGASTTCFPSHRRPESWVVESIVTKPSPIRWGGDEDKSDGPTQA